MNLPLLKVSMPGWKRHLTKLGAPGLIGLVLCALSIWAHKAQLPAERLGIAQLESAAREMRHRMLGADTQQKASTASTLSVEKPDIVLQALIDGLPVQTSGTQLQSTVLREAAKQGLTVQSVEWRGEQVPWAVHPRLWCQHMQMPVEGSYRAMRAWIDALLREPALSIEAIDIQRKDLMGDQIKAQVSLSLWWRMTQQGEH